MHPRNMALREITFYIDGYKIIMQGHNMRNEEMDTRGHIKAAVCIILNSDFALAHARTREHTTTLPINHEFEGRFLGIVLTFPDHDDNEKN